MSGNLSGTFITSKKWREIQYFRAFLDPLPPSKKFQDSPGKRIIITACLKTPVGLKAALMPLECIKHTKLSMGVLMYQLVYVIACFIALLLSRRQQTTNRPTSRLALFIRVGDLWDNVICIVRPTAVNR